MTLDHQTLCAIGQVLYGTQWQSQLARDLGISLRTAQRWARGQYPIPPGVWRDLAALCDTRGNDLLDWAERLDPLPAEAVAS